MFGFHLGGTTEETKDQDRKEDYHKEDHYKEGHHKEEHHKEEHHKEEHHKEEHHKHNHHRDHHRHHDGYHSYERELSRHGSSHHSKDVSRRGSPSPDPCHTPTNRASIYEQHRHEITTVNSEVQLTLVKLLEVLKTGNRELREMHDLLREKMEDVSNYNITLEERLSHFTDHVRKTDDEMGQLKGELESIERKVRNGRNDEEILYDIEGWKGAHCKAVQRQRERRPRITGEHCSKNHGHVPGRFPEVRFDKAV